MKKLMVYLDDETHEDLRQLAFRKRTSMAALIRYAVDKTFEDELDIAAAERALEEYASNPNAAITLDEYLEKRGIVLSSAAESPGRARPGRVAEGRRPSYRRGAGRSKD
ncbi:MAG: DUF6290 family protein [Dehalococcoidia bacterium]|nr:DUF6290 family protein [Dehalococcoidia bacterium]